MSNIVNVTEEEYQEMKSRAGYIGQFVGAPITQEQYNEILANEKK